jgi:hypothetical protein
MLKFEVVKPNTVLSTEGDLETDNCYAIVSGSVKVFKHDSACCATSPIDKRLKVTDLIALGAYGRHIATL